MEKGKEAVKDTTKDAGKDTSKETATKDDKKEGDKEGQGKVEKEKTFQSLKKGDYSVHVLIEEVRNLVTKDNTSLCSPVVKVSCFGDTKRTPKLKTDCNEYTFLEHMYFDKLNLSVEELDSQKVIIEVYDAHNTARKEYLGIYEFDFIFVYNNSDHALHNFWVALANPESDDMTKVRGFLKLSASVLMENDKRIELVPKTSDDANSMCVVPPQIKMEYMQLSIHIIQAEQLPDMDSIISAKKINRECNGFIMAKYLGTQLKTSVKDMKNELIVWKESIEFPVNIPVVSQKISLSVWDKDALSNDIIGSFEISVSDIFADKYKNFQYLHIYGAPLNKQGKYTDKMNENGEIGSLWKGRVLIKIDYEKTDHPKARVKSIDNKDMLKAIGSVTKSNLWFFEVFLYDAFYLPKEDDKYSIRISIQEDTYLFPKKKAQQRNIKWDTNANLKCQTVTNSIKEIPDVFIYLVDDSDNYICFQRISAETFFNNDDILVIKLLPDPSVGKVAESCDAGLIKLKIVMKNSDSKVQVPVAIPSKDAKVEDDEEEEDDMETEMKKMKEKLAKKPEVKQTTYTIVANVHQCRYMVPGDSDGTSDPYVKLKILNQEKKTSVKNDTLNCIWNENLVFDNVPFDINDTATWPIMYLSILDKDAFTDDLLGYNYIWLCDSAYAVNKLDKMIPKWHQLHLPTSNRPQGQILISFYIIESTKIDIIENIKSLDITPETKLYSAEINVLGLRDLKPLSMIQVKKAFIIFDLNSINVSTKDDSNLKTIKTPPKMGGTNPTINTVIKFDVKLPVNKIFMSDLQCTVHDYILAGLIDTMLGVFMVPIDEIISFNDLQITKDLKVTKKKLGLNVIGGIMKNSNNFENFDFKENRELPIDFINSVDNSLLDQSIDQPQKESSLDLIDSKKEKPREETKFTLGEENGKAINTLSQKQSLLVNEDIALDVEKDPKNKKEIKLLINDPLSIVKDPLSSNKALVKPIVPNVIAASVSSHEISQCADSTHSSHFLIKPEYRAYVVPGSKPGTKNYKEFEIEDESKTPPAHLYQSVGYNKTKADEKKHYRRYFDEELENVKDLKLESPFFKFPVKRGKFIDKSEETGIFEALSNPENKIIKRYKKGGKNEQIQEVLQDKNLNKLVDEKDYGYFKGLLRIVEKNKMKEYETAVSKIRAKNNENLLKDFKYLTRYEDLSKRILVQQEVFVRIYILDLGDLAKKDAFSESDPYLKIYLGDQMVDEVKNRKDDMANVKWCKCYELVTILPGNGNLKVEVWDYDPMFSDELIGSTTIDIEADILTITGQT